VGSLRLCLALIVACAHFRGVWIGNYGAFAVRVFFIVSGFYMALILTERAAYRDIWSFYASRALKLLPLYWVVSLVAFVLFATLVPVAGLHPLAQWSHVNFAAMPVLAGYGVISLTTLIGADAWTWLGFNPSTGALSFAPDYGPDATSFLAFGFVPQAWTIGLEMMFYIAAPFIVRRPLRAIAALAAMSLLCRGLMIYNGVGGAPWDRVLFPTELVFFLLGVAAYRLMPLLTKLPAPAMLALGGAVTCYCLANDPWQTAWHSRIRPSHLPSRRCSF
jgi:peptidoglycan/LPS O-acetylase OafA/YrhL